MVRYSLLPKKSFSGLKDTNLSAQRPPENHLSILFSQVAGSNASLHVGVIGNIVKN